MHRVFAIVGCYVLCLRLLEIYVFFAFGLHKSEDVSLQEVGCSRQGPFGGKKKGPKGSSNQLDSTGCMCFFGFVIFDDVLFCFYDVSGFLNFGLFSGFDKFCFSIIILVPLLI